MRADAAMRRNPGASYYQKLCASVGSWISPADLGRNTTVNGIGDYACRVSGSYLRLVVAFVEELAASDSPFGLQEAKYRHPGVCRLMDLNGCMAKGQ